MYNIAYVEDKSLICQGCGEEFTFTVGEQKFYQEEGFDNEPKRYRECRIKRKYIRKPRESRF